MSENVLVFPEKLIEGYNIKGFIKSDDLPPNFLQKLLDNSDFVERDKAEENPAWKQIIPYCYVLKDEKYLSYFRTKKAGESRLRGKRSIGFGGHINDGDVAETKERVFYLGLEREIKEELGLNSDDYDLYFEGVLYDDSNLVGQVHFGIVYSIIPDNIEFDLSDDTISEREFLSFDELMNGISEYENWSQILIKGL